MLNLTAHCAAEPVPWTASCRSGQRHGGRGSGVRPQTVRVAPGNPNPGPGKGGVLRAQGKRGGGRKEPSCAGGPVCGRRLRRRVRTAFFATGLMMIDHTRPPVGLRTLLWWGVPTAVFVFCVVRTAMRLGEPPLFDTPFWDFYVPYCASVTLHAGANPYDTAAMWQICQPPGVGVRNMPYIYLPSILTLNGWLMPTDLSLARLLYLGSMVVSAVYMVYQCRRLFFPDLAPAVVAVVFLFGAGHVVFLSLESGNLSFLLYAILYYGFAELIRGRAPIYVAAVTLVALVKFQFLVFYFVAVLFSFRNLKWCVLFFLGLAAYYATDYSLHPEHFMQYADNLRRLGDDISGLGMLMLINDGSRSLGLGSQFFTTHGILILGAIWAVMAGAMLLGALWVRYRWITGDSPGDRRLILALGVAAVSLAMPRLKQYDFYGLLPAFLFLIIHFRTVRPDPVAEAVQAVLLLTVFLALGAHIYFYIMMPTMFVWLWLSATGRLVYQPNAALEGTWLGRWVIVRRRAALGSVA